MPRILVIDDDEIFLVTLERLLVESGHAVVTANDGAKAAKFFRREPFEVIITDIIMPNREGLETIGILHREFPEVGVIAMSGDADNTKFYLDMAARLGAHRTLAKPFSHQQLNDAIADTLAATA